MCYRNRSIGLVPSSRPDGVHPLKHRTIGCWLTRTLSSRKDLSPPLPPIKHAKPWPLLLRWTETDKRRLSPYVCDALLVSCFYLPPSRRKMSAQNNEVLGVIVLARNGDRVEYFQEPSTYSGASTQTTALGEVTTFALDHSSFLNVLYFQVQSYRLGTILRQTYLNHASPSAIQGMRNDLVDNQQIHVRIKAGGEGTVVFDSAIALLQGLFPPNSHNKIQLANGSTIVAPLGGYQYVPGRLMSQFYLRKFNVISKLKPSSLEMIALWKVGPTALYVP